MDMDRQGAGTEWDHFCQDIFTPIRVYLSNNKMAHGLFPEYKLRAIQLIKNGMYIDEFKYGKNSGYKVASRVAGIIPNVWIKGLRGDSKNGNLFNVEMIEQECGIPINDFKVPAICPAGATDCTVTTSDSLVTNADGIMVNAVTYALTYKLNDEQKSVDVTVYENKKVSPGVTGTYTLDLGVVGSAELAVTLSAAKFASTFESSFGYKLKDFTKEGDCNRGFSYHFSVDSSHDIPDPVASNTGLSRPELTPEVNKIRDGGLWFKTISGNQMRQRSDGAEVTVVDKSTRIPLSCGGDCSFTYSTENLPTVLNVVPDKFASSPNVKIYGNNFNKDVTITVGGVECTYLSHAKHTPADEKDLATQVLDCQLVTFFLPGGVLPVIVADPVNGRSVVNGQMINEPDINSVDPESGSANGGQIVTIFGRGLSSDTTVTFGGAKAEIIGASISSITVKTPPGSAGATEIVVSSDFLQQPAKFGGLYSFVEALDFTTTASNLAVAGGQTVSVTSTLGKDTKYAFWPEKPFTEIPWTIVYSNGQEVTKNTNLKFTDETVQFEFVTLPKMNGNKVTINNPRYGDFNVLTLDYQLVAVDVKSEWGNDAMSSVGGSDIVITVEAGNLKSTRQDDLSVKVGDKDCPVSAFSAVDNEVNCTVPNFDDEYNVELDIVSAAWSPKTLTVYRFEKVTWSWSLRLQGGVIPQFKIQSIDNKGSDSGVFSSETVKGEEGSIELYFNCTPGTYSYSSGIIGDGVTEFQGTITVLPPKELIQPVILTVAGTEARLTGFRSTKKRDKKSAKKERMTCNVKPFTTAIDYGKDSKTTVDNSIPKYPSITLSPDWSPIISEIIDNQDGTYKAFMSPVEDGCVDNYKVTAKSLDGCSETINFQVTSVGTGFIYFEPVYGDGNPIPAGDPQQIFITQNGRGFAREGEPTLATQRPKMNGEAMIKSNMSGKKLSTNGGTVVTIPGFGFLSSRIVDVTANSCETLVIKSDTEVLCTTKPMADGFWPELNMEFKVASCSGGADDFIQVGVPNQLRASKKLLPAINKNQPSSESITFKCDACDENGAELQLSGNTASVYLINDDDSEVQISYKSAELTAAVETGDTTNTYTLTFTGLSDYGPGRVRVVYGTGGSEWGLLFNQTFSHMEKAIKSKTDREITYSLAGGETVVVEATDPLPADLEILLVGDNGVNLCSKKCEIELGDPLTSPNTFSFVSPPSNSAVDVTATLSVSGNGGRMIETNVVIKYEAASTPNVASVGPNEPSYTGGDTLTIIGSGFNQVEASGLAGMLRGKKKKRKMLEAALAAAEEQEREKDEEEPAFHYLDSLNQRSLECDYLTVMVGGNEAVVTSCDDTEIVVRLPYAGAGTSTMSVFVDNVGFATFDSVFEVNYVFSLTGISPTSGSLGGGTKLTILGTALTEDTVVTVCGVPCTDYDMNALANTGTIICETPVFDGKSMVSPCTVTATQPNGRQSKVNRNGFNFSFDSSSTPTISGTNAPKGGTAGGTTLVIDGTLFTGVGDDQTPEVTIDGVACVVKEATATKITCQTGKATRSIKADIVVNVPGLGNAEGTAQFWYIDRFSSPHTWGCTDDSCLPEQGEIVVVSEGETLLLDQSTPVLAVLLIDGGTLIWDRQDGIQLKAEYIIVTKNGHFEIGTEDEPFCPQTAEIILYGHHRSIRLPIYGAKVFAARSGTVDIHGCEVITWTQLAETADAGTDSIKLEADIRQGQRGWQIGDEIVVATTGKRLTMTQSEHVKIKGISSDGTTLTLNRTLLHTHLGVESTWNGKLLEQKAEVGLLTRNIKMRGNVNMEWHEALPECKVDFESDEDAIQNCFLNKFNDEVGSDKFGSHLIMHKVTHAKIEYMEVTHSGQGFQLGRYSLHFHMSGHQPDSYFRGLGIHHTFNRAMTIHGTHMALFEWNVAYRCEGHNFFIEDGFEEMNTIQYNLGIFARPSSSMLNTDQKATTFWVTNTNNRIRHNHAAGGAFFGFWINPPATHHHAKDHHMHGITKCPRTRPVLEFNNNTAHTMGEYGYWIFEEYMPATSDCGDNTALREQQVFNNLVAWRCKRGFEIASAGNGVRIHNSIISDNTISNFAFLESRKKLFGNLGYGMADGISIGYSGAHPTLNECTEIGLETPWKVGSMDVDGIEFYNFDKNSCKAIDACYNSDPQDCGFTSEFQRVKWKNSPNRFRAKWEHVTILYDRDGTLTAPVDNNGDGGYGEGSIGLPDSKVVASSGLYDSAECQDGTAQGWSRGVPSSVCSPNIELHRFGLNKAFSASHSRSINATNEFGQSRIPFRICRSTHSKGYMGIVPAFAENYIHWYDLGHVNNLTYRADIYDLGQTKSVRLSHEIQRVDYATGLGTDLEGAFPALGSGNKAYSYTDEQLIAGVEKKRFTMLFEQNSCAITGSPDAAQPKHYCDTGYNLNIYKCFWLDCIPPPTLPPTLSPNQDDCRWSDTSCWESGVPPTGVNVTIQQNVRMIVDVPDIQVDLIFVEGGLVFDSTGDNVNFNFNARQIVSNTGGGNHMDMIGRSGSIENNYKSVAANRNGRTFTVMSQSAIQVGSESEHWPCDGEVNINLSGDKWSTEIGSPSGGVVIGAKAIAALGALEMHGCPVQTKHTFLKNSVTPGNNKITLLDEPLGWKIGGRLFIASSSYEMREAEEFVIANIDGSEITLDGVVRFPHYGAEETTTLDYNGWGSTHFGASVGYLSRNIKIDGNADSDNIFGGRVVVMRSSEGSTHRYGHAQFSNVEFTGMGQYGYREENDRRGAIFMYGLQDTSIQDSTLNIKSSYVKDCAFHKLFNTAIGSSMTFNHEVSGNVIYNTVDDAVVLNGATGVKVNNNLIARVVYSNLHESSDISFVNVQQAENKVPAAIWLDDETQSYEMVGNIVAGSDGDCYRTFGEKCNAGAEQCSRSAATNIDPTKVNRAHSCIRGVTVMADGPECNRFSNYMVYKTIDFGTFLMSDAVTIVENSLFVNNWVSLFSWQLGSFSINHHLNYKRNTYKNIIIDQFNHKAIECDEYNRRSQAEIITSGFTRNSRVPFTTSTNGVYGLLTPDYTGKKHKWPVKSILFAETYASLLGGTCAYDLDFRNFGVNCGRGHAAIGVNSKWVDHKHKIELVGAKYQGDAEYKYHFARPKLGDINLASCVDMDCDGLKRAMIVDVDGSFTGTPKTTLVPQSEYHYERWVSTEPHYYLGGANVPNHEDFPVSNPQRGLGDYRIPWSMVTRLDGSRIPYGEYAEKVGTLRDFDHCTWEPRQNGYNCPNRRMATLLLESFDHDRETRRFAPVAMRENGQKLIDIGNGVIDHSCCFGYSCQLRLAQHYFNVECGKTYEYHAAGTVPKHARFHLLGLDSENDDCQIRVDFYVARQNRQKIYRNDVYVASNQEETDGSGNTVWKFPDDNLKPAVTEKAGANYFQRLEQVVYFNIDAGSYIDVKSSNTLLLELEVVTEMTVDQFWDSDDLPNLLAVMLNIDKAKIKKMNVISESTVGAGNILRKKSNKVKKNPRASSVFTQFEIALNWDEAYGRNEQSEQDFVKEISNKILQSLDNGELSTALNREVASVAMALPPKPAVTPEWYDDTTNEAKPGATIAEKVGLNPDDPELTVEKLVEVVEEVLEVQIEDVQTYEDVQEEVEADLDAADDLIVYEANSDPTYIGYETSLREDHTWESGVPMTPPIVVYAYNSVDEKIKSPVKTPLDPWEVTVSLKDSTPGIKLSGDLTCAFTARGECKFTNLIVNGEGDIILVFEVTYQGKGIEEKDKVVIDKLETEKVVVTPPTVLPPVTTASPTDSTDGEPVSTTPATTESTMYEKPKDQDCLIKKNKQIICDDRNLVTGRNLAIQIMKLSVKARKKVKSLDVSRNPNLNQQTLKAIMNQLPGLRSIKAANNGWISIPPKYFSGLGLKTVDVSFNELECVQNAFEGLTLKQLKFTGNEFLQKVAGGVGKAKKKKIAPLLNKFNKLASGGCPYF